MKAEQHTKELFEAVLYGVSVGIVVIDEEGNCPISNETANRLLGDIQASSSKDLNDLSGFYESDKVTPVAEDQTPFSKAMRGEATEKEELFIRNELLPFGRWCTVTVKPLVLDTSGFKGGVIIIEDITDRRKLADEVARSNKDLQQFAYVAAHDLQEPLRSITGFGDLLLESMKNSPNPKAQDQLKRILGAAKRMQTLISALLAYARIETRAKPPQLCDCTTIVANVINDLNSAIKATNAKIIVGSLPKVMADPSQLAQVFHNLIGNALKYKSENPVIEITAISNRYSHHFCVADNGIGIDMQFAERIFVIFQRLHNKSEYEGVGIGLALCKKTIENHGGQIWIESKAGQGTEVHFTLPIAAKGGGA